MLPIRFQESNEAVVFDGMEVPFYESSIEYVTCWQLNKEELELINKTGKIWQKAPPDPRHPFAKLTVYNPFKKLEPLQVNEDNVDRVIIHLEDDEELVLYKLGSGEILNIKTAFPGQRMRLVAGGWEAEYSSVISKYQCDPDRTYILKRVRNE